MRSPFLLHDKRVPASSGPAFKSLHEVRPISKAEYTSIVLRSHGFLAALLGGSDPKAGNGVHVRNSPSSTRQVPHMKTKQPISYMCAGPDHACSLADVSVSESPHGSGLVVSWSSCEVPVPSRSFHLSPNTSTGPLELSPMLGCKSQHLIRCWLELPRLLRRPKLPFLGLLLIVVIVLLILRRRVLVGEGYRTGGRVEAQAVEQSHPAAELEVQGLWRC